jgi:hypothetical protein
VHQKVVLPDAVALEALVGSSAPNANVDDADTNLQVPITFPLTAKLLLPAANAVPIQDIMIVKTAIAIAIRFTLTFILFLLWLVSANREPPLKKKAYTTFWYRPSAKAASAILTTISPGDALRT